MPCTTSNCPFIKVNAPHFDTMEEAQEYFDNMMEQAGQGPSFRQGEMKVDYLPMGVKQNERTVVVPAGLYVLCDPKQILTDDIRAWNQWSNVSAQTPNDRAVGASINGYSIVAINTQEDGSFTDSIGRQISTESGYIGLIPLEFAENLGFSLDDLSNEGPLVNFDETALMKWNDGKIDLGEQLSISIEPDFVAGAEEHDDYYYELDEEFPSMNEPDYYPENIQDRSDLPREERRRRAIARTVYDQNDLY